MVLTETIEDLNEPFNIEKLVKERVVYNQLSISVLLRKIMIVLADKDKRPDNNKYKILIDMFFSQLTPIFVQNFIYYYYYEH